MTYKNTQYKRRTLRICPRANRLRCAISQWVSREYVGASASVRFVHFELIYGRGLLTTHSSTYTHSHTLARKTTVAFQVHEHQIVLFVFDFSGGATSYIVRKTKHK